MFVVAEAVVVVGMVAGLVDRGGRKWGYCGRRGWVKGRRERKIKRGILKGSNESKAG